MENRKGTENIAGKKKGKREYLNSNQIKGLIMKLSTFLESMFEIPRIRHGKRQTLDTLINEEALLLAKYLRNEKKDWEPRIVGTTCLEI